MEDFKIGDLVIYHCEVPEYSYEMLALVTEIDEENGEYTILFLDDGSDMACIHSEIMPAEVS